MSHGFVHWAPSATGMLSLFLGLPAAYYAIHAVNSSRRWKRAELANEYLRHLSQSEVLQFTCHALEWRDGLIVVPETLRPLVGGSTVIRHSRERYATAMAEDSSESQPPIVGRDLYRTATDAFLTWLVNVRSAIECDLFLANDIELVAYWLVRIRELGFLDEYIERNSFSYSIDTLGVVFAPQIQSVMGRFRKG